MRSHHARALTITFAILLLAGAVLFTQDHNPTGNAVATFGAAVLVTGDAPQALVAPNRPGTQSYQSAPQYIGPWNFLSPVPGYIGSPAGNDTRPPTSQEPRFILSLTQTEMPAIISGSTIAVPLTIENPTQGPTTITITSTDVAVHPPQPLTIPPGETVTALIDVTVDWEGNRELAVTVSDGATTQQLTLTANAPPRAQVATVATTIDATVESPRSLPSWGIDALLLIGLVMVGCVMAFAYRKPRI